MTKEEIIMNEDGYCIIETTSVDDSKVEVVEKLDSNNTMFSYYEKYVGKNGVIILGASTYLKDSQNGNIMPGNTQLGIWYYDEKFLKDVDDVRELLDSFSKEEDPIKKLYDLNASIHHEKNILPDLHVSALASMKHHTYTYEPDVIRYNVEKEKPSGEKIALSFAYKATKDFREQLQNLYSSIIGVNELEHVMFDLCGVSDQIRPNHDRYTKFKVDEYIKYRNTKTNKQKDIDKRQKVKLEGRG